MDDGKKSGIRAAGTAAVAGAARGAAAAEKRPWKQAALWLALLGPLFFLSYGFANHYASTLAHVGSFVYGWERVLPFWDWTILPYMSIDLFYAISLFVCATRAELRTHAIRLLSATLVSVAFFMLFPLKFSFQRPPTHGFNGWLFDVLTGFDQPFNQAPSLHVSLLMILWVLYARHARGLGRALLHAWFSLIAISVLTTYQHHFIDVATGVAVGVLCLYLIPGAPFTLRWRDEPAMPAASVATATSEASPTSATLAASRTASTSVPSTSYAGEPLASSSPRNVERGSDEADRRDGSDGANPIDDVDEAEEAEDAEERRSRLARRYTQGAAIFLLLGVCAIREQWITAGLLLAWPAFAFAMVGLAYAGQGTRVFQKQQGAMRASARVALAPYLLAAWVSSRLFTRRIAPHVQVYPGVWIGRAPSRRDLQAGGFDAVIDLAAEFPARRDERARHYTQVSMLDLVEPSFTQLSAAVAALQDAQARGQKTLVHCALGFSRSALVIAAWRMTLGDASVDVFERLRGARAIAIAPSYPRLLADWLRQRKAPPGGTL